MSKCVLIIGGGSGEVQVALDLADSNIPVTLVEESPSLHSHGNVKQSLVVMPSLLRAANHPNIRLLTNATVTRVKGENGDYKVWVNQQPRYIDPLLCNGCGKCERECPVTILSNSASSEDGHKAIHRPGVGLKSVPSALYIEKQGTPPCTAACPAGVNAHGYVAFISQGRFSEALDIITDTVPFPRVLGRVCNHDCETKCSRGDVDDPVSICALKRFATSADPVQLSPGHPHVADISKLDEKTRVAIIGAGPAGLTAARELARLGRHSTVFEAMPVAGGMMTIGMPGFRLPGEVRQADINDILGIDGIEIRTSMVVGKDMTIDDLRRQGYQAILIAVGANINLPLGIQGESLKGVTNSISFLKSFNLKKPVSIGPGVIVIGGGYTGIDSARTAVRLVSSTESTSLDTPGHTRNRVLCVDRYSKEDILVNPDEVAEAEAEGVEFDYLVSPIRIIGNNGRVTGVEFQRMKKDESAGGDGSCVIPVEGSEFIIETDSVIVAIGQSPDLSFLKDELALTIGQRHIIADSMTQATSIPGIFAAGDAANKCGPMINAVATGRRAATCIDKYLRGEQISRKPHYDSSPVKVDLDTTYIPPIERHAMPLLPAQDRKCNFEEVKLGFSGDMAVDESRRCLHCGGCSDCLQCELVCELGAVNHRMIAERLKLEDIGAIVVTRKGVSAGFLPPDIHKQPGVYTLGTSAGEEALARGSALAARIMVDLADYRRVVEEPYIRIRELVDESGQATQSNDTAQVRKSKKGVFVCGCGGSISDFVNVSEVVKFCATMNDVTCSVSIGYACSDKAADEIKRVVREKELTDVIIAGCACCNLDQICFSCSDRRIICKKNLLEDSYCGDVRYEYVNIREHCAWVHQDDPRAATAKAGVIIGAGIARSGTGALINCDPMPVEQRVMIIGAGPAGKRAAEYLASQGFSTTVVMGQGGTDGTNLLSKKGVNVITNAVISDIYGGSGRYSLTVAGDGWVEIAQTGVIIINTGNDISSIPLPSLLTRLVDEHRNSSLPPYSIETGFPDVFICTADGSTSVSRLQGEIAACRAAVLLNRGRHIVRQTVVCIDEHRCRGCGDCISSCPFGALVQTETDGISVAAIDRVRCRGCGLCVAHCPTGALSQGGYTDEYIITSLESMLS